MTHKQAVHLGEGKLSFTLNEAAAATGIGKSSLYSDQAAGRLEFHKRGRKTLIMRSELERYLASLVATPRPETSPRYVPATRAALARGPMIDICKEIDRLDQEWERIDLTEEDSARNAKEKAALFAMLGYQSADSAEVVEWREIWLARAIENEWHPKRVNNMRKCVQQDRRRFPT